MIKDTEKVFDPMFYRLVNMDYNKIKVSQKTIADHEDICPNNVCDIKIGNAYYTLYLHI